MVIREKVEDRRYFSYKEKKLILRKSNGRCSHCGCSLEIGSNFSIEHVVPISKGGTNDMINLVALCKECNRGKSNLVLQPKDYYKFLSRDVLLDIEKHFTKYCEEFDWLTIGNLFSVDNITVPIVKAIFSPKSRKTLYTKSKVTVSRLLRRDYKVIKDFLEKYNKVFPSILLEDMGDYIHNSLRYGAMYSYQNNSGDMLALFLLSPFLRLINDVASGSDEVISYALNIQVNAFIDSSVEIEFTTKASSKGYLCHFFSDIIFALLNEAVLNIEGEAVFPIYFSFPEADSRMRDVLMCTVGEDSYYCSLDSGKLRAIEGVVDAEYHMHSGAKMLNLNGKELVRRKIKGQEYLHKAISSNKLYTEFIDTYLEGKDLPLISIFMREAYDIRD